MDASDVDEPELLERAAAGDRSAVNELFSRHRARLRWMVRLRLNRKLQGRIDPSDVLQDAYLETCRRLDQYLQAPQAPFFLWLRQITARQLLLVHRRHLGTRGRDAARELAQAQADWPAADSVVAAAEFVGKLTSPSAASVRAEAQALVQQALEQMDVIDREVLLLRHFEMLTNDETAHVLDLSKTAASNRYVRALRRLSTILEAFPGLLDDASAQ
jgi:RNA polymerase sigma-70 factor (ECF subfamily)